jgi:hypothetical protein
MLEPVRALRSLTVTYSKTDLVVTSLIGAVVSGWATVAGGGFSFPTLLACEAAFFAFYLAGTLFLSLPALATGLLSDLPLRLLVGYGLVNTATFGLAWVSPLGLVANFAILCALLGGLFFSAGARKSASAEPAGVWLVALCVAATTLWCQDSIHPRAEQGDLVSFKPWIDGFYHAVHIRIFAASHGAASIEDWRLLGVFARPYHYGIYLLPAFIKQASGLDSYSAFAGVLAPSGVFFTGLAAYAFFGSLWGAWPGVAAAAALLLLPDGAQQGMQNPFMSYHWLTQISPSATYGLALLAVAWLFVIKGSVQGSRAQLFTGWTFAALVLVYKLHYVFANALLLLLVPAIFFATRLGPRRRALWIVAACGAYWAAVVLAQQVPGVPLIRFDGSCVGEVLRLVQSFAIHGALRDYVVLHMGAEVSKAKNLLFGIPYIGFATLGLALPALLALVILRWRRQPLLYVIFPVLLLGNFLSMFFGLALDFSSSTPDEISHRPLIIVYFFALGWLGGSGGSMLFESARLGKVARPALLVAASLLLVVPAHFGPGVQRIWAMPAHSPVRLPLALVRVAEYMRANGPREDVFQHSQFDRIYAFGALSERRTFVSHTMIRMPFRSEMVEARTNAIDLFMALDNQKAIFARARAFGFRWFVLERGERVNWPPAVVDHPVLAVGPYRLYEF